MKESAQEIGQDIRQAGRNFTAEAAPVVRRTGTGIGHAIDPELNAALNNLNSPVSRNNGGLSPVATNPNHRDASLNAGMIMAVEAAVVIMEMAVAMAVEDDKIDSYTIN